MNNSNVIMHWLDVAISILFSIITIAAVAQDVNENVKINAKVYTVGACRFRIDSGMFGGGFEAHSESSPPVGIFTFPDTSFKNSAGLSNGFTLFCIDASDEKIGTMLNARQVNGKWMMYNPWPHPDEPELTAFDRGAHPRTVQFKGSNWTGTGLTVDATTGDEKRRARMFYFCLIHNAHALCGKSPVQWLADLGRPSELWKIRAILQSVEFVDVQPSLEPNSASGATSVPRQ